MPNKYRNEVEIELNNRKILLRPTIGVLASIDTETGVPIVRLAKDFESLDVKVDWLRSILKHASAGADKPLSEDEIDEIITYEGLVPTAMALLPFFAYSLYGGKAAEILQQQEETVDDTKKK